MRRGLPRLVVTITRSRSSILGPRACSSWRSAALHHRLTGRRTRRRSRTLHREIKGAVFVCYEWGHVSNVATNKQLKLDRKMGVGPDGVGPWEGKLREYGDSVLGVIGDHCGNLSEHAADLALLVSEEQAIDYCRYYDNHHLELVKASRSSRVLPQLHLQGVGDSLPPGLGWLPPGPHSSHRPVPQPPEGESGRCGRRAKRRTGRRDCCGARSGPRSGQRHGGGGGSRQPGPGPPSHPDARGWPAVLGASGAVKELCWSLELCWSFDRTLSSVDQSRRARRWPLDPTSNCPANFNKTRFALSE